MYHVQNEQAFREALLHQNLQHISGTIYFKDGTSVALNDNNLLGTPRIDSRIITDSETFNISELYIGTLEFEFIVRNISETLLIGAEVTLQVQIEFDNGDLSMPVPMGVWDIVAAPITSANTRKITAYDHIARLARPLGADDSVPGTIRFSDVLYMISSSANIEFSQTVEDLAELFPRAHINDLYPISYHYAATCWLAVQYIAQYLGAYVIAARDGRIEFRRYDAEAVLTITADERFESRVDGSVFYVRGFGYTDKYGHTVECLSSEMSGNRESIIYLPQGNTFIIDAADDSYESIYTRILDPIREEFDHMNGVAWYPGYVEFYGNPTLDVGDMIYLTGGSAGTGLKKFLICQNTWQFRAPQTIVSGGPPRIGNTIAASSGAEGNSIYNNTTINTTKSIILDQLKCYSGLMFDGMRTAARGRFSVTESTAVFVTCTLSLSGKGNAEVYIDGAKVGISMSATDTLSFTLPVMVSTGTHSVQVTVNGSGEVKEAQGTAWGQEITPLTLDYEETDWEYTTSANSSEITGYTGGNTVIEVPEMLGGKPVTVICDGAFSVVEQDEISVYIPDGVETIE